MLLISFRVFLSGFSHQTFTCFQARKPTGRVWLLFNIPVSGLFYYPGYGFSFSFLPIKHLRVFQHFCFCSIHHPFILVMMNYD